MWKQELIAFHELRCRDCIVVGCTTTYAISATKVASSNPAHAEVCSIQHYVIKNVSGLRQVGGFFRVLRFLHRNWSPRYSWNVVEIGIKHHNPNLFRNTEFTSRLGLGLGSVFLICSFLCLFRWLLLVFVFAFYKHIICHILVFQYWPAILSWYSVFLKK
jgi:hypothetical protein